MEGGQRQTALQVPHLQRFVRRRGDRPPAVRRYRAATQFVHDCMPRHPSIVNSSILSALEGRYGDYHATDRTAGSGLWINPLMSIYWCFQVEPVARRVLYLDAMMATRTREEVHAVILRWLALRGDVRAADCP